MWIDRAVSRSHGISRKAVAEPFTKIRPPRRRGADGRASANTASFPLRGTEAARYIAAVSQPPSELTRLLDRAAQGDAVAARKVLPLVYDDLRRLAHARMAKLAPGQTLQATALVHEAYLRIHDRPSDGWGGRAHFFFAAARAMHDIVVEQARRKSARKRGGGQAHLDADEVDIPVEAPPEDVLALDDALAKLRVEDPDGHQLVELRYFAGLTVPEIAELTGTSVSTIERRWRFVKAWLGRELGPGEPA